MGEFNPYQAPKAAVADQDSAGAGRLRDEPARADAGRGAAWIGEGIGIFRAAPLPWLLIALALGVGMVILAFIPFIGAIATNLLLPFFVGGLILGCRALEDGDELRFDHLLAARERIGALVTVGAIYLAGVIVVVAIAAIFGISMLFGGGLRTTGVSMGFIVVMLIAAGVGAVLAAATWFAPALIVLHELSPLEAMRRSFYACLVNWLPFLVFGVIALVLGFIAILPFGLGLLVLGPVLVGASYVAYKDILVER